MADQVVLSEPGLKRGERSAFHSASYKYIAVSLNCLFHYPALAEALLDSLTEDLDYGASRESLWLSLRGLCAIRTDRLA